MRLRDPSEVARAMDRSRLQLERFCKGLLISTKSLNAVDGRATRVKKFKIRALSKVPASAFMFENDEGREISIADYFQTTYNYTLRFPGLPCVQVSKKAFYPMEICTVEKGNKYTKKLAPDQVAQALKCEFLVFSYRTMCSELNVWLSSSTSHHPTSQSKTAPHSRGSQLSRSSSVSIAAGMAIRS